LSLGLVIGTVTCLVAAAIVVYAVFKRGKPKQPNV
jgi:hypothetical protein